MTRRNAVRGFTLVELMCTVAIVGILATVAAPKLQTATLRARKSERDMVLNAVSRGAQAVLVRQGRFGPSFKGEWNPPGDPTTYRRAFDFTVAGWKDIDVQIDGSLYHRYFFFGDESTAPMTLTIWAQGDLDGDGVVANRKVVYDIRDGALLVKTDDVDDDSVY